MSMVMEFSVRSLFLVIVAFAVYVVLWNAGVCCGEPKTSLVTGMVFCDQCLLGTLSALSQPLAGAHVSLECYQGSTTAAFWASTDENGVFSISVEEEDFQIHGDGRCTVKLARSTDMDCYIPTDIANGSSGAAISSAGGVYRERAVYYVGPFAYRMSRPAKACNALQLGSRHGIILESSELPVESFGASSRGLKTVGRSFAEEMATVPSSASTIPSTATSTAKPPSYSMPVTKPTPAHGDHSRVKHSGAPASNNHSPTKCVPLPPLPLDPELITKLHYPPCKDETPKGGGAIPPPSTPRAPSPIGPGSPILPPTASPPKVGSAPPKANSPSYGGSPIPKLPPSPPLSPPPPAFGVKPAPPSPTTPSPPSPPHKHPIHRPHPHHRPSPLAPPPPTNPQTPIRHPSPSPDKNPPPPSGSQLRYPPPPPPPPSSYLKPSPPLTHPPQPPSTPKMPPHHHQTPHHMHPPSLSPPPQPPTTIPLPFPHPPPPF